MIRGHSLRAGDLQHIDRWSNQHEIACLFFLGTFYDAATNLTAKGNGFRLTDTRITLGRAPTRLSDGPGMPTRDMLIRPSINADVEPLQRIAAASHRDTRFYVDLHFPRAKCQQLYECWITRSCQGWADQVLVAEVDEAPVGYITCHLPSGDEVTGTIGLIGVAPHARRRGAGQQLVLRALDWFAQQQVDRVAVATQGRNIGAQDLYQRCGFVTQSLFLWYPKWYSHPDSGTP